jgi:hypothetical protein
MPQCIPTHHNKGIKTKIKYKKKKWKFYIVMLVDPLELMTMVGKTTCKLLIILPYGIFVTSLPL